MRIIRLSIKYLFIILRGHEWTVRGLVSPLKPPDSNPVVPQHVVFDTDYGPFIDDTFALGLLFNSGDLFDLKYVIATSELPYLSAKCILQHLDLSRRSDISVGSGTAGSKLGTGFQPFPGVDAPTDETNITCDPEAANFVLDGNFSPFDKIYYVPVAVTDAIGGAVYSKIIQAVNKKIDKGATVMLDFYRAWSAFGHANPKTLIHEETMRYDPETESAISFDSFAIMLAIELL